MRIAGVSPVVLPGPLRIAGALWDYRADAVRHTIPTLVETVLGFAIAVVLAIAAAAAMDRMRVVRRAVEPHPGHLPDDPGRRARAAVPALVRVRAGAEGAGRRAGDLLPDRGRAARRLPERLAGGGGPDAVLRRDRGPGVPHAPLAAGAALVLHGAADLGRVRGDRGGVRGVRRGARGPRDLDAAVSQNSFRTDLVFAAIVVTSALSLLLYWLVGMARRVAIPWAPGVRREPDARGTAVLAHIPSRSRRRTARGPGREP